MAEWKIKVFSYLKCFLKYFWHLNPFPQRWHMTVSSSE